MSAKTKLDLLPRLPDLKMRTQHTTHTLPTFPIYSSTFISPTHILLGGGGGAAKSGIKNKIRLYKISDATNDEAAGSSKGKEDELGLELVDEFEFGVGEDAPMSLAWDELNSTVVCGVNETEAAIASGDNEHCRVFTIKENKLHFESKHQFTKSTDLEHYQKVTAVSPSLPITVIGSTAKELHLLSLPTLAPLAKPITLPSTSGDLWDAAFSPASFVITTSNQLIVYGVPSPSTDIDKEKAPVRPNTRQRKREKSKSNTNDSLTESLLLLPELDVVKTIEKPALPKGAENAVMTFRSARFHPNDWTKLYGILNTTPKGRGKRGAYIAKWNTKTWEIEGGKLKKLADASVTCIDISPNGKYIAYGLSDCSIGLLDAETLVPVLSILKAHDFPCTTLKFSPGDGKLLVSGSADNTVRIVRVPEKIGSPWATVLLLLLALIALLLAIVVAVIQQSR